ncbi:MAG: hypothetical protein ACLP22_17800 [Solirubrobacteraceae bacterium]
MTREQRRAEEESYRKWTGASRPYDLIKEATFAILGVILLTVILSLLFSSPDDPAITMKSWARNAPVDFATVATSELDGTSVTATYGPPYNNGTAQHILFIKPAAWIGVTHPINAEQDFVVKPLRLLTSMSAVQAALDTWQTASAKQQTAWSTAYTNALGKATANADGSISVPAGDYGPVATIVGALVSDAQSGGLDGALLTNRSEGIYQTDYTKILMFLQDDNGDGGYFNAVAARQHLLGSPQWGMMNETDSFPGQVWLWLYAFWYQIKPFSTSLNADLLVMVVMTVLSVLLIAIPVLPIVKDIPRKIPIYKLIWRDHYRSLR